MLRRVIALTLLATVIMATPTHANPSPTTVVYAVGDSIAEGAGTAYPEFQSWPQRAFNRILGPDRTRARTVAHGGQCLTATICGYGAPLTSTWQAEVLNTTPKPTTVIVEIGRNDLAHVTDDQMINAYGQLRASAAMVGIRVIIMTIAPAGDGYQYWDWTEPQRRSVNARIRSTFAPDVADVAASLGDSLTWGPYDSGDNIHWAWPAAVVAADTIPLGRIM
jgi:lysophospholipase L1-like esterase